MADRSGWMAGDDDPDMPEHVRRWLDEPDPPEPWYDPAWVEVIYDALIACPPSDYLEIFWICGEDHDHERRAAVGMMVDYINDQVTTYRPGTPQWADAAARGDELQRLTMGD